MDFIGAIAIKVKRNFRFSLQQTFTTLRKLSESAVSCQYPCGHTYQAYGLTRLLHSYGKADKKSPAQEGVELGRLKKMA